MADGDGIEPTTGELARRFDRLDSSIESGFRRLDERLDKMVTTDVFAINQQANETRITELSLSVRGLEQKGADERQRIQDRMDRAETTRDKDRRATLTALASAVVAVVVGAIGWVLDAFGGVPPTP